MRKLKANLAGYEIELAVTFGAAAEIHEKVGDPLAIAREAQVEAMMVKAGQIYHPRWQFTVKNVPVILHEGIKAAGGTMSLEKVQEITAEAGFMEAKAIALDFVAAIVTPKSQELDADKPSEGGAPGE
jgi:hypothetical protein